jgi:hypothetical protein
VKAHIVFSRQIHDRARMMALPEKTRRSGKGNHMNTEHDPSRDRVRLPGFAESAAAERQAPGADSSAPAGQARKVGIRQVRRMSNWTAAALIVGTGATTLALAHHAVPVGAPAATSASSTTGAVTKVATQGTNGPRVSHSVATTSASGVTTTTTSTSQVVNGKTVVNQTRSTPAYHDN